MVLPPREWLYSNVMSREGCMRYVGYGKANKWSKKFDIRYDTMDYIKVRLKADE